MGGSYELTDTSKAACLFEDWQETLIYSCLQKVMGKVFVTDPKCPNPFVTIPGAYHTLFDFMRTNGLERVDNGVIPCFETDGESMDVYIACK